MYFFQLYQHRQICTEFNSTKKVKQSMVKIAMIELN